MKAAYIEKTGGPEAIRVGELPRPEPGRGEALVRVKAVAVNPIDTYIRSGLAPMPLPIPYIIGLDFAGVVEAVGPEAGRVRVGERVWGSNQGLMGRQGCFAEYAAVHEDFLYPTPEGVADRDAAAIGVVALTAHLGLFGRAHLRAEELVFVSGGSGGVGSMVIQMAVATGARVITTAGDEVKAEMCRKLGAERVILYRSEEIGAAVREFAPQGVDLWWEVLQQPDFDRAVGCLAKRGRMVVVAGRQARPQFPVGPFYTKDLSLYGFAMFNATPAEQRAAAEDINRWLADGRLRANVDRVLPLEQAAEAHRLQEASTVGGSGELKGKIVLTP